MITIIHITLTAQGSTTGVIQSWPHPLLQQSCPLVQSLSLLQASQHAPNELGEIVGHTSVDA